jgi:cytidylate kinase
MSIRIITVEREYGSGGAAIAEKLARRLEWKLWDTELTQEIARRAHVRPEAAARHDERVDSLMYRLLKSFARGSH